MFQIIFRNPTVSSDNTRWYFWNVDPIETNDECEKRLHNLRRTYRNYEFASVSKL